MNKRRTFVKTPVELALLLLVEISLLFGLSSGAQASLNWDANNFDIHSGDYNNDGFNDVIIKAKETYAYLATLGNPTIRIQPPSWVLQANIDGSYSVFNPVSAAQLNGVVLSVAEHNVFEGDFDGDGAVDLLLQGESPALTSIALFGQLTEGGEPRVEYLQDVSSVFVDANSSVITITDTNNDGTDEVVLHQADGSDVILYGTSSGITSEMPRAVGKLSGSFSVSESGAANYNVPVTVPPGINGIQPQVSLSYSTEGGNGHMGMGWAINAESAIQRCPTNLELDGKIDLVDFDSNDLFCYQGSRLILKEGTGSYGSPNSEYYLDSGLAITVKAHNSKGTGPEYFSVQKTDGKTLWFGSSADSQMLSTTGHVYSWSIKRVDDLYGNSIHYQYNTIKEDGEHLLENISYGSNNQYEVYFEYESRPDVTKGLLAVNVPFSLSKRLKTINVNVNNSLNSSLTVSYIQDVHGSTIASSLEGCSDYLCQPKIEFEWIASDISVTKKAGVSTFIQSNVADAMVDIGRLKYADFNGDGRTDIYRIGGWGTSGTDTVHLANSDGSFKNGVYATNFFVQSNAADAQVDLARIKIADFNGDGRADIYRIGGWGTSGADSVHFSNGDGTFQSGIHATNFFVQSGASSAQVDLARIKIADFNGDGRADIYHIGGWGTSGTDTVHLSNGDGSFKNGVYASSFFVQSNAADAQVDIARLKIADFNGDGCADIYRVGGWGNTGVDKVYLSLCNGTFQSGIHATNFFVQSGASSAQVDLARIKIADFNGDGRADIYRVGGWGTSGADAVYLSNGDGTFKSGVHATSFFVQSGTSDAQVDLSRLKIGDFNGDGKADIYRVGGWGTTSPDNLYISNGDGTFEDGKHIMDTFVQSGAGAAGVDIARIMFGDFDGNGSLDIYRIGGWGTTGTGTVYLNASSRSKLKVFTDSFGNTTEVTYQNLSQIPGYVRSVGPTSFTYPVVDLKIPQTIVTSFTTPNGIGGTNTKSYKYTGLRAQARGIGTLGFRSIEATDETTGIKSTITYSQDWENHTNGMVERSKTFAPNGVAISQTFNDYDDRFDTSLYSDVSDIPKGMYNPYIKRSTTFKKDLHDNNVSIVSAETELDARGRPEHQYSCNATTTAASINATVSCATISKWDWERKQHVQHEYYPESYRAINPDLLKYKWITSEVPHTLPFQESSETRVTFYDYNVKGQLSTETVEPEGVSTSSGIWLKKEFGYTASGQLETTTISGADIATRSATTVFDDQGRMIEAFNALGHSSKTFYTDDRFPWKPTHKEDVNGLVSETLYDSFGRAYKQIYANGNTSETEHEWCDATSCDIDNGEFYYVVKSATGKTDVVTYYDKLSRAIRSTGTGFDGTNDGKTVTTETVYNAKGQIEKQYLPYYDGEFDETLYTQNTYDDLGRLFQAFDAKHRPATMTYSGLITSYTGITGKTKVTRRNTLGKTVEVTDHEFNSLTYTFDMWGSLARVEDSQGNITKIGRNLRGFRTKLDDPDQGVWEYAYNVKGQMLDQTDAKGQITHSTFDLLGRRLTRTTDYNTANAETSVWAYDAGYKGIGKLNSLTNNSSVTETYHYDTPYGLPSDVSTVIDGETYTSSTTYDSIGRIDEITYDGDFVNATQYPSGFTVKNGYHPTLGILESVKGVTGVEKTYWQAVEANASGQMIKSRLGLVINTERTIDPATGETTGVRALSFNSVIQDLQYQWNDDSRLNYFWDHENNVEEAYGYDSLNRLTDVDAISEAGNVSLDMEYDALGNITYKSDVGTYDYANPASECDSNSHAGPHAVSRITDGPKAGYRCYDANGNMISGDGRTIGYSASNKPTHIEKAGAIVDFYYGPSNARYKRVESKPSNNGQIVSETIYLGGGQFEKETIGSVTKRKFYIGGNALITMEDTGATQDITTSYILKDHLGSTNVIVSFLGVVQERMSFDPWGNRRLTNLQPVADPLSFTSAFTTRGFTGHEMVDSVSLIHMNGRMYDPVLARFISPDPLIQAPKDLQSFNRYSYVVNNPLGYTDPSGYSWLEQAWEKVGGSDLTQTIGSALIHPMLGAAVLAKHTNQAFMRWSMRNGYMKHVNSVLLKNDTARGAVQIVMLVLDAYGCSGYCSAGFNAYMVGISGGDYTDMAMAFVKTVAVQAASAAASEIVGGAVNTASAGYSAAATTAMQEGAGVMLAGTMSYASGGKFIDGVRGYYIGKAFQGVVQAAASMFPEDAAANSNSLQDGGATCAPIQIATGRKFLNITDIKTGRLVLTRHYNSFANTNSSIDGVWRLGFERSLQFSSDEPQSLDPNFEAPAPTVTAIRADGQATTFTLENNQWVSAKESTLEEQNNQWLLTNEDNSVEIYNADGQLQRIEFLGGYAQTLTYNDNDQLQSVEDSDQRSFTFDYNNNDQLFLVTTHSGETYQYSYNLTHHLKTVRYPDNTEETLADNPYVKYVYEDARFPQALTGFYDESNTRFGTWRYDSQMRADYEHTEGFDENTLVYQDAEEEGSITTVTDALGRATVYHFNDDGKATFIEGLATDHCIGSNNAYEYDDNGFISAKTDWNENRTEFTHNDRGLETSRTEAVGTEESYTVETQWHDDYRLPVRIIAPGKTVELDYNDDGLLLSRTEIDTTQEPTLWESLTGEADNSRTWTYEYNNQSLVETVDGPRINVADITTYDYDNQGNRIAIENAQGHRVEILEQTEAGLPVHVLDANNVETHFVYNPRGWLTEKTVIDNSDGSQATTVFTYNQIAAYDGTGYVESVEAANGTVLSYEYNAARHVTAVTNNNGDRMEYELDNAGNPVVERVLNASGDIQRQQQRVFDELSRVINTINASGDTTIYHYDANGNQTEQIDALGRVTHNAFDGLNRLVKITDANLGETLTQYNDQGLVEQVTDARQIVTRYIRNGFGDVITRISQDTGTTEYRYDNAGNRIVQKDARNVETFFAYDNLNRVTDITYPTAPEENIHYTYDDAESNGIGRLTTTNDQTGSTELVYNGRGNVVQTTQTINSTAYGMAYHYDSAHQLEAIQYPSGLMVRFYRDALGQVEAITQQATNELSEHTVASNITYLPFGPLNELKLGNGLTQHHGYDLDYRIESIALQNNGTPMSDKSYGYNSVSQITRITDALTPANDKTYDYDRLNRLTDVIEGNELQPVRQEHFSYDAVGNRESYQRVANGQSVMTEQYVYADNANRLMTVNRTNGNAQSTRSLGYDAVGNTINDARFDNTSQQLTYGANNRLATVKGATYGHNAKGQRVIRNVNGSEIHYIYDTQDRLIAEAEEGVITREYVYLGRVPLAVRDAANDVWYYSHNDHLGTPKLLTDQNKQIVWSGDALAFGQTEEEGQVSFAFRFPGQIEDAETGYFYNYFRDYDASLGRYLQSDPIGLLGGVNTFGYVGGNVVITIDIYGLDGSSSASYGYFDVDTYVRSQANMITVKVQNTVLYVGDCIACAVSTARNLAIGESANAANFLGGALKDLPIGQTGRGAPMDWFREEIFKQTVVKATEDALSTSLPESTDDSYSKPSKDLYPDGYNDCGG